MSRSVSESDWKIFRELRQTALDRFCERVLHEIGRKMAEANRSPHERYLSVYKIMDRRDDELARAFNDLRRSTALMQLAVIWSLGVLTEDELARFSPKTRDLIKALSSLRNGVI